MLVQFLKNVFRYPLIVIGAPFLVGLWVFGWFLLIGCFVMAGLWFNGEFVGQGWPILSAIFVGSVMLSLTRHHVRDN